LAKSVGSVKKCAVEINKANYDRLNSGRLPMNEANQGQDRPAD
jgi:hypothetical protein